MNITYKYTGSPIASAPALVIEVNEDSPDFSIEKLKQAYVNYLNKFYSFAIIPT